MAIKDTKASYAESDYSSPPPPQGFPKAFLNIEIIKTLREEIPMANPGASIGEVIDQYLANCHKEGMAVKTVRLDLPEEFWRAV